MGAGLEERLRAEWYRDLGAWGAPREYLDQTYDDVIDRYGEPQRHYHTLEHIAAVLRATEELASVAGDLPPVRLAAWYHDVVYDPAAADNEARSAVLAAAHLTSLSVPPEVVREAARLIELTATHHVEVGDRNGAALLDADLAILAAAPDRYDRYVANVRAEYRHVEDEAFRRGRSRLLADLSGRPYIFHTQPYRAEREARARANLERELAALALSS
jgi:predicted metal-dependent HD superfamily phosphohydrolase